MVAASPTSREEYLSSTIPSLKEKISFMYILFTHALLSCRGWQIDFQRLARPCFSLVRNKVMLNKTTSPTNESTLPGRRAVGIVRPCFMANNELLQKKGNEHAIGLNSLRTHHLHPFFEKKSRRGPRNPPPTQL